MEPGRRGGGGSSWVLEVCLRFHTPFAPCCPRWLPQALVASGVPAAKAWNQCALSLAETARSHCYLFMLRNFIDTIAGCVDTPAAHRGPHTLTPSCGIPCTTPHPTRALSPLT